MSGRDAAWKDTLTNDGVPEGNVARSIGSSVGRARPQGEVAGSSPAHT